MSAPAAVGAAKPGLDRCAVRGGDMTHLLPSTKISSWLEAIDPGFAELRACCKEAESATLTFFNAFHSNTLSPARCDELATTANNILARIDVAKRRPLPPTDVLFRTYAEAARGDAPPLPPPDAPAKAARKLQIPADEPETAAQAGHRQRGPRRPSIGKMIARAEKATGKPVTSITLPDGTKLDFGKPASEPDNPWFADLPKETKQ